MSDLLIGTPNIDATPGAPPWTIGNLGDIHFDANGELVLVSDVDKLTQNIGKILLTDQGANLIDSTYGSVLQSFVGQNYSSGITYSLIRQTILDAMGYIVNQYSDSTNFNEQIGTVETLAVKVDAIVTSTIILEITLTNQSGKFVTVGLTI